MQIQENHQSFLWSAPSRSHLRKVKTMSWMPATQRLKAIELRNQQDQRVGTLSYHQATSMDLITQDVWSDFSRRGDDASWQHFGQPSAGREVLCKLHQCCAGTSHAWPYLVAVRWCLVILCLSPVMSMLGDFRNCWVILWMCIWLKLINQVRVFRCNNRSYIPIYTLAVLKYSPD